MKLFRLAAFAAVLSVAACTPSPTESVRGKPAAPAFDAAAPAPASDGGMGESTTASDSTARGGSSLGSGN